MSVPLTVNGVIFNYPANFDTNWGIDATGWAQAITAGTLQKAGGSFPLTADVDFGAAFGLKAAYLESRLANPATSGTVRLLSADSGVVWRNNANNGNLALTTDASDNLLYNGHILSPSGAGPVTSITGTANQVIASASTGAVTLSLPQSIDSTSTPTFASLSLTSPLSVLSGGTGNAALTAYAVLTGGTSSVNPVQSVASVGSAGQVLTSNGAGALPSFQNTTGSGTVNSGTAGQIAYYATTGAAISGSSLLSESGSIFRIIDASSPELSINCSGAGFSTILFMTNGLQNQINTDGSGTFGLKDNDNSRQFFTYTRSGAGLVSLATPLAMGSNKITGAATATTSGDAVSYRQGGQAIDGSTANSGGSAGTIQQGTVSTPDLRANAVTQSTSSVSTTGVALPQNITSKTITTIGGTVLVLATANADNGGTVDCAIDRGGTTIYRTNNPGRLPGIFSIFTLDTPASGTYTYNFTCSGSSTVGAYNFIVVELRA